MGLISFEHKLLLLSYLDSRNKNKDDTKPRYVIEVTKKNIDYCKNLMKLLDLRHLDNIRGNFLLYENKYWFLYKADVCKQKGKKEILEGDKNMDLLVGSNSTTEFVDQQQ